MAFIKIENKILQKLPDLKMFSIIFTLSYESGFFEACGLYQLYSSTKSTGSIRIYVKSLL